MAVFVYASLTSNRHYASGRSLAIFEYVVLKRRFKKLKMRPTHIGFCVSPEVFFLDCIMMHKSLAMYPERTQKKKHKYA